LGPKFKVGLERKSYKLRENIHVQLKFGVFSLLTCRLEVDGKLDDDVICNPTNCTVCMYIYPSGDSPSFFLRSTEIVVIGMMLGSGPQSKLGA